MKTLATYLQENDIDQVEFARQLAADLGKTVEACAVAVSRVVKKNHRPGDEMIIAIYRLTSGAVEPNDYYELPLLEQNA